MAAFSLFRETDVVAVTSRVNTIYTSQVTVLTFPNIYLFAICVVLKASE